MEESLMDRSKIDSHIKKTTKAETLKQMYFHF
jgi:hypothetical protein